MSEVGPSIRDRRKALGWDRSELARRAGLERSVVQLVELGTWGDAEAIARVVEVLGRAEAGELDVALPPLVPPK